MSASHAGRYLPLGLLAAPVLIVQAARFLLDAGPAAAPASPSVHAPEPVPPAPVDAPPALDDDTRAAARWIAGQRARFDALRSPMHAPDAGRRRPRSDFATIDGLRLTGVMGSGDRVLVSINNRIYRVGDTVARAWTITRVDPRSQAVELTNDQGDHRVLHPTPPG